MNDNANYSYISTVVTPDETTHYIKDAEARTAITNLETSKQDKIDASHKIAASNVSGLATVATSGSYNDLSNKPTIPPAVTVDTTVSSTSTNAIANKTIKKYVDDSVSTAVTSVMKIKGTKASEAAIKAITSAKTGDVWINTADGSEWVATKDITAADATAWEKLGFSVDLSGYAKTADLGTLAVKNSASGSYTPAGGVTVNSYTPEGSIAVTLNTTTVNSITDVGTLPTFTRGTFSAGTLPSHGDDSFSQGTLPSHAADTFSKGTLPTFTRGTFSAGSLPTWSCSVANETLSFSFTQGTLPSHAADSFSQGTLPSFTQGTFSAGTLPTYTQGEFSQGTLPSHAADTFSQGTLPTKGSNQTVATSVKTQSFTGTAKAPTGSFTGTAATITVS